MDTQGVEDASGADAGGGGPEPEDEEDAGVGGVASGSAFEGADAIKERGQVEGANVVPDFADGVVGFDELIE